MKLPVMTRTRPFQSTLPTRGATQFRQNCDRRDQVSIHAPHTGSDLRKIRTAGAKPSFNPRSPHGERRGCDHGGGVGDEVSIHAPHTGSD